MSTGSHVYSIPRSFGFSFDFAFSLLNLHDKKKEVRVKSNTYDSFFYVLIQCFSSRNVTFEHASICVISREVTHGRQVRGARLVSLATINGEFALRLRAAPSLVLVTRRPGNIPPLRKIKRLCTRGLSSGLYISWPICTVHTCHCWRFRFLCISTFVFNNEGFRVCICV